MKQIWILAAIFPWIANCYLTQEKSLTTSSSDTGYEGLKCVDNNFRTHHWNTSL